MQNSSEFSFFFGISETFPRRWLHFWLRILRNLMMMMFVQLSMRLIKTCSVCWKSTWDNRHFSLTRPSHFSQIFLLNFCHVSPSYSWDSLFAFPMSRISLSTPEKHRRLFHKKTSNNRKNKFPIEEATTKSRRNRRSRSRTRFNAREFTWFFFHAFIACFRACPNSWRQLWAGGCARLRPKCFLLSRRHGSLSLSAYTHTRYGDDAGKSTKCEEHNIENKNNTSWRQGGKLNIPLCWVVGCLRLEECLEIGKDWIFLALSSSSFHRQLLGAFSAFTVHSILTFVDELAKLSSEVCSLPARKMKKTGS